MNPSLKQKQNPAMWKEQTWHCSLLPGVTKTRWMFLLSSAYFPCSFVSVFVLFYGNSLCHGYILFSSHFFFFFCLFRATLWYTEVPRLGIELELQLQAYTTVTAMPDPSHISATYTAVHSNTASFSNFVLVIFISTPSLPFVLFICSLCKTMREIFVFHRSGVLLVENRVLTKKLHGSESRVGGGGGKALKDRCGKRIFSQLPGICVCCPRCPGWGQEPNSSRQKRRIF